MMANYLYYNLRREHNYIRMGLVHADFYFVYVLSI